MFTPKEAYPLCWPLGKQRTKWRDRARFDTQFGKTRDALLREIKLLGGSNIIISSNIPVRNDGLPYSHLRTVNGDPAIAVYFTRKQKQMCFACDRWDSPEDNLHAITLTISALRGITRWGTGDMMEATFTGFAALPEKTSGSSWWEVLGVPINATREQARTAYTLLVKKHHPDVLGGNAEMFRRVQEAWEHCERTNGN